MPHSALLPPVHHPSAGNLATGSLAVYIEGKWLRAFICFNPCAPPTFRQQIDGLPDLVQDQLDVYPHRSLVTDRDAAPIVRVWLLANDTSPDAIPRILMIEAIKLVLAGKGVLILSQRPEPEVDIRTMLLQALDLFTATQEVAGHV